MYSKSLSVGKYISSEETADVCKGRIGRIVRKQKKCYCKTPSLRLSDEVDKSMECPLWLDEEFLYTLNYGPSESRRFKKRLEAVLDLLGEEQQREQITLMDRAIADKLHKAIFGEHYTGARFLTDWSEGPKWLILDEEFITPFDYDPRASETKLFMSVETFITAEILDPSSIRATLCDPRPSIVPIALDIIDLVGYLASLPVQQGNDPSSTSVNQCLLDFLNGFELRSIDKSVLDVALTTPSQPENIEEEKVILRYLADMLKNVTYQQEDSHWEILGRPFPGPDLILGSSPSTPPSSLTQIFLDDFKADFICSGPFKLIQTVEIRHHLRLTEKNEIQLFIHSAEFLSMYNSHSLKRSVIQLLIMN
jgi:hypothetical protein